MSKILRRKGSAQMAGRTQPVEQRGRRPALYQPERLEFLQVRDGANSRFACHVVPRHRARSDRHAGASAPAQNGTSAKADGGRLKLTPPSRSAKPPASL